MPPYTATAVRKLDRGRGAACSARPTWTSSRWAPRTRTPPTATCSTRGTRAASPAAPRAARRRRSRGGSRPARSAPTPAARSASPPSLCGIVGLKPTYGAISRYGMIAFASSLDQCGPLTRDVTDAALLLRGAGGARPLRLDLGRDRGRGRAAEPRGPEGPQLRRPEGARRRGRGDRGRASARSSSGPSTLIEELGGEVSETELPHAPHGISAYYVLAPAEASANLARFDGVRYGLRAEARRPDRDVRGDPRRRASAPR